jgi:hypothetical protein
MSTFESALLPLAQGRSEQSLRKYQRVDRILPPRPRCVISGRFLTERGPGS